MTWSTQCVAVVFWSNVILNIGQVCNLGNIYIMTLQNHSQKSISRHTQYFQNKQGLICVAKVTTLLKNVQISFMDEAKVVSV